jgi:fluoride exporter
MIRTIILIGTGGAIGSICRYLTAVFITKHFSSLFPLATFTANIVGCLLIGILLGLFEKEQVMNNDLRFLLITGFCGGYTTFSAFSSENFALLNTGNYQTALLYMMLSLVTGIICVWAGIMIIKFL